MNKLFLVHVTWVDSTAGLGWESLEDIEDELTLTHTFGFFVKETKDSLVIAHSFDPSTDEFNGRIQIPICAIENVKPLCQTTTK